MHKAPNLDAAAQQVARVALQYGRHAPTIREQFAIAAVTGILASGAKAADGTPLTVQQIVNRAAMIADAATNGRQRAADAD